jgi:hypothetical protein
MSQAPSESAATTIEWSTISTNIECPLCLYNLRGLSEPRCPECGYQFQWIDLLDPTRRRHRYLFEHHPERNVWSFFRTLLNGLWPRKFWNDVKPTHLVRPRRLVIYWVLCSFLVLLLPIAQAVHLGADLARSNAYGRLFFMSAAGNTPASAPARQLYMDANLPLPPSRVFFQQYWQLLRGNYLPMVSVELGSIAAWPWLTFAALMVFQASMRKAKVQRAHVLRCVIYSADMSILYTSIVILAVTWVITAAFLFHRPDVRDYYAFWLVLLLWVIRLDKLVIAYRKYLQFDHPFLTVLASQIIVLLGMAGLLYWAGRIVRWMIWGL